MRWKGFLRIPVYSISSIKIDKPETLCRFWFFMDRSLPFHILEVLG